MYTRVCVYIYIYIYIHTYTYIHVVKFVCIACILLFLIIRLAFRGPDGPRDPHAKMRHRSPWQVYQSVQGH